MVHPDVKRHWPVKWQSAVSIPRRHRNPPSHSMRNPKLQVAVARRLLDRTDLLDVVLVPQAYGHQDHTSGQGWNCVKKWTLNGADGSGESLRWPSTGQPGFCRESFIDRLI